MKGKARMYVPSCRWRKRVGRELRRMNLPFFPREQAVQVKLVFRVKRPQCHFGTGRNAGRLKPSAPEWPLGGGTGATPRGNVGDVDNYAKAVLDEMNTVCFDDDAQVAVLVVSKLYADDAESGVTFTIEALER